jgi:hypothetical protein
MLQRILKYKFYFQCLLFPEIRALMGYDIWEIYGTARQATDDNIIWRMRIACWITEATDTHSEYVILIAFPWHQVLRESASMLRYTYTYITCLVYLETKINCWDRNQDHPVCHCACKLQVACRILTNQYFPARITISYCTDWGSFIIINVD